MANKEFGENIKKFRLARGLTQQQLTDRLGLKNKSTLASWEIGKSEPDTMMISYLCRVFDIDANTLFGWDPDKKYVLSGNLKTLGFDDQITINKFLMLDSNHKYYVAGIIEACYENERKRPDSYERERERFIKENAQPFAASNGDCNDISEAVILFNETADRDGFI